MGNNYNEDMKKEALERLGILEEIYGLNPNVKKYFSEGKLYYSYLTAGGVMGSIDTINYDKRYASLVEEFEKQTDNIVYHVIESGKYISLLFVSFDHDEWEKERPNDLGVYAYIVNVDDTSSQSGFIKLDNFQGALRRRDDKVYDKLSPKQVLDDELLDEILDRIEILINEGMQTDLDVKRVFSKEGEICFSERQNILGMDICLVNRISANPNYEYIYNILDKQLSEQTKIYFLMVSKSGKLAFLVAPLDSNNWSLDRSLLHHKKSVAVVFDYFDASCSLEIIDYEMFNGGPLFLDY